MAHNGPDLLGIAIDNVKPLARRVCALDDDYEWGDGISQDCEPFDGDRPPSKWPNALDWRSPGFQPWGLGTATPSPAGYEATFRITGNGSQWPNGSDDKRTIRFYPNHSPDSNVRQTTWNAFGLDGGKLWLKKSYLLQNTQHLPPNPPGSLVIQAGAETVVEETMTRWTSTQKVWTTRRGNESSMKWFLPFELGELRGLVSHPGQCSLCQDMDFFVTLPEMGFGSSLQGGNFVAGLNQAVLAYNPDGLITFACNWVSRDKRQLGFDTYGDQCGVWLNQQTQVGYAATLRWSDPDQLDLFLEYFIITPDDFFNAADPVCCRRLREEYGLTGDSPLPTQCAILHADFYAAAFGSPQTCESFKVNAQAAVFNKVVETGDDWAGSGPEALRILVE